MKFIRKSMCFLLALLAICTLLNTQSVFASEATESPEGTVQTQEELEEKGESQPEEGTDLSAPQIGDVITEEAMAYLVSGRARAIVDVAQVKKYIYVGETWYGLFWKNGSTWQQWGGDDWWIQTIAYYPFQSGKIGYCLEPYNSDAAIGTSRYPISWKDIPVKWASAGGTFETEKQIGVSLIMAYGAPNNGDTSESGYYATATLIWDMCCGYRNVDGSYRFSSKTSPFYAAIKNALQYSDPTLWSEVDAKYNELLTCLANHGKVPSFSAKLSNQITDANTITLQYDAASGLYKASVTDTNQVLKHFNYISTIDGLSFSKSGNTLNISATAAAAASLSSGTVFNNRGHEISIGPDSVLLWGTSDGTGQVMVTMDVAADPVPSYFKLRANVAGKVKIIKTTNTGGSLSGWRFGVYTDAACTNAVAGSPFTTDAAGNITTSDLLPGTYYVKELDTSSGYWGCDNTVYPVTVTVGNTASVTVNNTQYGRAKIIKTTNTGANLSGWKFGVYTDAACTKPISGSPFTTGADGTITSGNILPGTYYVKELDTSSGYWSCDNAVHSVTVTAGGTASVTVNNVHHGRVKIIKTTNTGANLGGWKFGVYTDAACTRPISGSPFTTGADGTITSGNIVPGTYYVKELDTSSGYWGCDNTVHTVTVSAGKTASVTVNNTHYGKVKIIKATNNGNNLSGWKFGVYTDAACTKPVSGSPFTTAADGTITSGNLMPGKYYVKELDTSSGYWGCDNAVHTVTVSAGKTASVTVNNTHYGKVKIIKATNTGDNLSGWKFGVYTDAACTKPISGSPFSSAADGTITSGNILPGTYYVKELDTSSGYWSCDNSVHTVTVSAGKTASVTVTNTHHGRVQIIKTTNTGENLSGWKFGVYSDAACTKAVAGSPFTSSASGTITTGNLLPGTYWVKEIDESAANPDWDYDKDVKKVTVSAGETASVSFSNTHFGYAQIYKTTNTGKDLGGWKFNIYSDNACKNLVAGSPYVTDSTGLAMARLLPGTYYIREEDEISEHPDWVYDTQVHKVTVVAGQKASIRVENQQMGRINLIKATPDGGPVSGWIFEIYRASDNTHMGTYTSGADGTIISDYMLPGEYIVQERVDENGVYWCESENPQKVIIKPGETTNVTFVNRLKPGKISIQKVDITGEPLFGAEFLLEWSTDGTTWKPVSYSDSKYVLKGYCTSAGLTDGKLVSGEDGMVVFTGLHPEHLYRLTETKAPDGYQLLPDIAYQGGLEAGKEIVLELTVVNARTFELPETGSGSMLVLPVAMSMGYGASVLLVLCAKRKSKEEE